MAGRYPPPTSGSSIRSGTKVRIVVWWRRPDADLVRDVPDLRRIMPYVMRTRNESTVYFEQRVDVGNAERFVRAFNEAHPETRTTLFHVLLWASRQGLAEFPNINRFIAGGRLYQRRGIWISYSAKQRMQKGAPLIVLKREFDPDESFGDDGRGDAGAAAHGQVQRRDEHRRRRAEARAHAARASCAASCSWRTALLEAHGMFPRSFIDNDPLYATLFLTDLGSLGLDPVFHHLYEYGNVGTFGVLGRPRAEQIPDPDSGRLERKRMVTIRWSFDERIEDGLYAGYGIKHVKKLLEDPVKGGIAVGDDAVLAALGRDGAAGVEQA